MSQRSERLIHVPPKPGQATFFFLASAAVWFLATILCIVCGKDHPAAAPSRVLFCLGTIPGLLAWHLFGRRRYRVELESKETAEPVAEVAPFGARFALLRGSELPFGAFLEVPSGRGVRKAAGHLLCLRYSEWVRWIKPMSLIQYAASVAAFQQLPTSGYMGEACLVLPAAVIGMIVWGGWILMRGPWAVIDIDIDHCWFDDTCAGFGRGLGRREIVGAAPVGDGLRLTLEGGQTVKVGFPEGSLSAEAQQKMALTLLPPLVPPARPEPLSQNLHR